jgi:hypothetical protein
LIPEDTVGFEPGEVALNDGPARPMTSRVTPAYRRIDGIRRLLHRHADFPPTDRRQEAR